MNFSALRCSLEPSRIMRVCPWCTLPKEKTRAIGRQMDGCNDVWQRRRRRRSGRRQFLHSADCRVDQKWWTTSSYGRREAPPT